MLKTITRDRLKEVLEYCPKTGVFIWKCNINSHGSHKGKIAGCNKNGYRVIRIDGVLYRGCRLAWLYVNGVWPKNSVDHINGNPRDDRIENLRDVTHSENMQNRRNLTSRNKTGFLGVSKGPSRVNGFLAFVGSHYVGSYSSPEDAHEAYKKYRRKVYAGNTL